MDDTPSPVERSSPATGGTVEPAHRAAAATARSKTAEVDTGERFELRDPFAEVLYNERSFGAMAARAEQLGALRFTAVDANGQRSFVEKTDGEWQRRPVRLQATTPEQNAGNVQAPAAEPSPARSARDEPSRPAPDDTKVMARVDAAAEVERAARLAQLETALKERYIIKQASVTVGDTPIGRTEYRFRGDSSRVAFTESTFRLATDTNSPSVARSMVDVAQTRNWSALRISGHDDFKRMVWLEASVRGVKAIGYEPNPADLEVLKREREARQVNRIEPAPEATSIAASEKSSARGGGGRKAVLAAIEAVLIAKGISAKQREAVMTAAADKLTARSRDGQMPKVRVFDKSAPAHRPIAEPTRDGRQVRDRASPIR